MRTTAVKERYLQRHLTAVRLMSRMRAPSRAVSAVPNCCTAASSVSRRSVFSAAATASGCCSAKLQHDYSEGKRLGNLY